MVVVSFFIEAGCPIIASLNDMPGNPGHSDACASGHLEPPCSLAICKEVIVSLIISLQTEESEKLLNRGLSPIFSIF